MDKHMHLPAPGAAGLHAGTSPAAHAHSLLSPSVSHSGKRARARAHADIHHVSHAPDINDQMDNMSPEDYEESEEDSARGEKRAGRRKIRIEYIDDKSRRHITFSKRKAGIMKKVARTGRRTGAC